MGYLLSVCCHFHFLPFALLCSVPDPRQPNLSHSIASWLLGRMTGWPMGRSGGWLERGGGEKTGSFSTYSGCSSSVILVPVGLSYFPPISSPHESSPHWKAPAGGFGQPCLSMCRTWGEDTKGGPQTCPIFKSYKSNTTQSIFLFFCGKYNFIMKNLKIKSLAWESTR